MKYIFIMFLFFCAKISICQTNKVDTVSEAKLTLDMTAIKQWETLGFNAISDNGKYISYTIYERPKSGRTLFIESLDGKNKMAFLGAKQVLFSRGNSKAIIHTAGDTLIIQSLVKNEKSIILGVGSEKLVRIKNEDWLVYKIKESDELCFLELASGVSKVFKRVTTYQLSKNCKTAILQYVESGQTIITWLNFLNWRTTQIWKGRKPTAFLFSPTETQLAMIVDSSQVLSKNGMASNSIWLYNDGKDQPRWLANNDSFTDTTFELKAFSNFNNDLSRLYVYLKKKPNTNTLTNIIGIDIWNHKDPKLQSQQLQELTQDKNRLYLAVINVSSAKAFRIQQDNEDVKIYTPSIGDELIIANHSSGGDHLEKYWNPFSRTKQYLVNPEDGKRMLLFGDSVEIIVASPDRKFLIGKDNRTGDILSYELSTSLTINLTESLPISLNSRVNYAPFINKKQLEFITFTQSGNLVLSDNFDIWTTKLNKSHTLTNITKGFGKANGIKFKFFESTSYDLLDTNKPYILQAFDTKNKNFGFFKFQLNGKNNPKMLSMGPYNFVEPISSTERKARNTSIYILQRGTSAQSPNFYWTSDFKFFNRITNVFPERRYNWLTTELMNFATLEGNPVQGILYKPSDFNPEKKYPVIFTYYEHLSDGLNMFIKPEAADGQINIPWFTSRGYLVFVPDILVQPANPGASAFNSVCGAARFLAQFPWVDTLKMGLHGHSFGGYETNYIVSHTHMFACAISAAGVSDQISEAGYIGHGGRSNYCKFEVLQYSLGALPHENIELYVKNSPIFNVSAIETPLLIMHNMKDDAVGYSQGVELYNALRRIGKRIWLLQYDNENHSLSDLKFKQDYTLRMTQFYDHLLKGIPPPYWMTTGVPAIEKGIVTGFELDNQGSCALEGVNNCPICDKLHKKGRGNNN